jgi:hypothetical protein
MSVVTPSTEQYGRPMPDFWQLGCHGHTDHAAMIAQKVA